MDYGEPPAPGATNAPRSGQTYQKEHRGQRSQAWGAQPVRRVAFVSSNPPLTRSEHDTRYPTVRPLIPLCGCSCSTLNRSRNPAPSSQHSRSCRLREMRPDVSAASSENSRRVGPPGRLRRRGTLH